MVELLVVIAIIIVLAGLILAMLPSLASATAEANGAANLQGWLNVARQKAIRNQSPFGLRLWIKDLNTMLVSDCQYIEQPDDFSGGMLTTVGLNSATVIIIGADLTGGFSGTGNTALYPVQPGDSLEVLGSGLMHLITQAPVFNGTASQVTLNTPILFPVNGSANYRILRAPRPIGQETLSLPDGVYVDLSANTAQYFYTPPIVIDSVGGVPVGAHADVLFSPAGSVITPGAPQQTFTALWVRQPDTSPSGNLNNVFSGSPTVIAVFQGTGLVAAYPPTASGANPYIDIQ